MFTLALRSIRKRPGRFTATLLAAFLGAGIVMAFTSLGDTASAPGVDDTSAESLGVTSDVVGGYGTLLVFFAVASTLTVNVRQRAEEIGLLRETGATPAQIKRMVVGEAAVVSLIGSLLAIGPAVLGGRTLLDLYKDTDQVAPGVDHVFGSFSLSLGVIMTVVASAGAAFLAVRRATRAAAGTARAGGRGRKAAGAAALVVGAAGISATFAMERTAPALMAAPAYGAILLSVGLALLSPGLLRGLLDRSRGLTTAGASGFLGAHTLRGRADQLAGVFLPLIVFTGMATATLYMQAIETDAVTASGMAKSVGDKNLETVNLVAVGVIVTFSCLMLVNSLYAATAYRTREFGQQRLAGATPGQVLRAVGVEGLAITVTGVVLGTLAAGAGILPFTRVRTGSYALPVGPGIWIAVVGVAVAATFGASLLTTLRVLRTPAVHAVAVAA
ncbi:FtsX-like permease family protein [Streptomyces tsukubensis]|uniref:Transporter n=1 Tax=Streptomyces tsukubensis TaxID=83656 RepID=A0A1V4AHD8_9ACTN|nr:ABC transporter permease [Streptomyces tsukubensis]OON82863.1 transporter [Streptomyces tsukubensis]QFR91958.1 FtsX-like permease family protein [Streptomyces tsukubensis]